MLSARNINNQKIVFDEFRWISALDFESENIRTKIAAGDVLLTIVGTIGRTAVVPDRCVPFALQRSVAVLKPAGVDSRYLAYAIDSPLQQQWLIDNAKGTAQKGVYLGVLSASNIPFAPANEQTRIVDKLEELLSDLDAGVAELKTAQKKLAQYRQSLLKAAVEGRLTEDWRARNSNNADSEESGSKLLARILRERRARWEAKQLAKFEGQGKAPPKGWQNRYPAPLRPDSHVMPSLPQDWTWATLDQLTEFITSGSRGWADYYADQGATFIRSQNINRDWLDLSDIAFVNPPENGEGLRTKVRRGDLLLTITGANVGKTAAVAIELNNAYVSQHVALIRPLESRLTHFLHLFLTAVAGGRGQLNKEAYGAGKPGLNLQQVAAVSIPLPSAAELTAVMDEVNRQLLAASAQEDSVANALRQSAAQRKNILQSAFSGQLVLQDPQDEPASVLLARIRDERAARETTNARSRLKKKAVA